MLVSMWLLQLSARFAALHVSETWLREHELAAAKRQQD